MRGYGVHFSELNSRLSRRMGSSSSTASSMPRPRGILDVYRPAHRVAGACAAIAQSKLVKRAISLIAREVAFSQWVSQVCGALSLRV